MHTFMFYGLHISKGCKDSIKGAQLIVCNPDIGSWLADGTVEAKIKGR